MKNTLKFNLKEKNGITLIALVITIIVLLILAGVSIAMLTGENSILTRGSQASVTNQIGAAQDAVSLLVADKVAEFYEEAYVNGTTATLQGGLNKYLAESAGINEAKIISEIGNTNITVRVYQSKFKNEGQVVFKLFMDDNTASYKSEGTVTNGKVEWKLSKGTKGEYDSEKAVASDVASSNPGTQDQDPPADTIPTTTSYIGYYADLTADGTVDGVIYADLAIGRQDGCYGADTAYSEYGVYTIPKETSGLKNYYISKKSYKGPFGTKDVLSPTGTGKDRFYVMALTDIASNQYYWYYAANGKMDDYETATSVDFGKGKKNTQNMIAKWNAGENGGYGAQNADRNYNDMWGAIQTQYSNGWFVPSRGEWAAFGEELGITDYSSKSLSDWYWSSSQGSRYYAWGANFYNGCMSFTTVSSGDADDRIYVRLSTTF